MLNINKINMRKKFIQWLANLLKVDYLVEVEKVVYKDKIIYKDNIKPINDSLSLINKLQPVTYNWNDKAIELNEIKSKDKKDYGLIAQEVDKIIPEVVGDMYGGEYKGIDYIKLVPILIGAIKELNEEINELKNKINYF